MTSAKKIGSHCEQSSIAPVVDELDEPELELDESELDEPELDESELDEPELDSSVVAGAVVAEVDGSAVDMLVPESEPLPEVSVEVPPELAPPLLLEDEAVPLSVALVAPGPPQAERERRRAAVEGRRAGRIGSGADLSAYREDYKESGRDIIASSGRRGRDLIDELLLELRRFAARLRRPDECSDLTASAPKDRCCSSRPRPAPTRAPARGSPTASAGSS